MKESVYIDTTIPSYYFDERESLRAFTEITRKWWDEESGKFEKYISVPALQELEQGDYPNKNKTLDLIQNISVLNYHHDVEEITKIYIEHYVMPNSLIGDAIHLAHASYYSLDYLLTWNCSHLANANKYKHIRIINGRLGLNTPQIVTPMELF